VLTLGGENIEQGALAQVVPLLEVILSHTLGFAGKVRYRLARSSRVRAFWSAVRTRYSRSKRCCSVLS
jgi:hypothetical protein